MPGMFVMKDDGRLVEMVERPYDSESVLQDLLSDHPNLLPGDQIDPEEPRRWLLVRAEAGVPSEEGGAGHWALDHLFLDQDGVLTLVEVKRSTDTRIRREVVGQMLDYAANSLAFLPVDRIRAMLQTHCAAEGLDPDQEVMRITEAEDVDGFWERVKSNLASGRIRLLFVADQIPVELRRIIEFLNRHTDPLEVLGVEVRQYTGEDLRTLVSRVYGQTIEATTKKTGRAPGRQWSEETYFPAITHQAGEAIAEVARRILNWALDRGLQVVWGVGAVQGTFTPTLFHGGARYTTMTVWTTGRMALGFGVLVGTPAFGAPERREELRFRLSQVPGVKIAEDRIDKYPSLSLNEIVHSTEDFLAVWDWFLEQVKATA